MQVEPYPVSHFFPCKFKLFEIYNDLEKFLAVNAKLKILHVRKFDYAAFK